MQKLFNILNSYCLRVCFLYVPKKWPGAGWTCKILFLLIISITSIFNSGYGQQTGSFQQIKGQVLDQFTGLPVPGVTIRFQTSCCCTDNAATCQCISDTTGNFSMGYLNSSTGCNMPVEENQLQMDTLYISAASYLPFQLIRSHKEIDHPFTAYLTPLENNLSEVLVTAARFRQNRSDIPAAIGVIDSLQIALSKATQIDQLINKVPGVFMADLGNEQHEMSIRQPITTKSLFLYLEDGLPIRTSGLYNHNALLEMNLAATSRIEVLKGPASAQYGPEAVGGAVNLISVAPPENLLGKITAEADNNGYKKTALQIGDTFGKFGMNLSGYYANRHNGPIDFNDYHKTAFTLNTIYKITPSLSWQNKATYVDYYADMSGSLDSTAFAAKNFTSHYQFTYRKVRAFRASSVLTKEWNNNSSTKLSFMYRDNQTGQNPAYRIKDDKNNPLKATGEINMNAFKSYVGLLQHRQQFNWHNSSLIMGISADISPSYYTANYIEVNKNAAGDYFGFNNPDSLLTDYNTHINNYAAFLQWQMDILQGLRLTLAGRYDRFDYDFTNHLPVTSVSGAPSSDVSYNHWTPKIGLNYNLKRLGFYASYAEGYVPPQVTELFNNVKVPFLKPQIFHNYEIGGWLHLYKNTWGLDWSLYHMLGTNEIISYRNSDGSSENKNAGKTAHSGLELGLNYQPDHQFQVRFSSTLSRHKFQTETQNGIQLDGNQMQAAPRFLANASITYRPDFVKGLYFQPEYQRVGSYYMDDANTTKYNGFNLVNLRTGFQWHKAEIWVNAVNLLDNYYATVATKSSYGYSYNLGMPFTLTVGLAFHF